MTDISASSAPTSTDASNHDDPQATAERLLKELDDAIQTGPWDETTLLKAIRAELVKTRNRFAQDTGLESPPVQQESAQQTVTPHARAAETFPEVAPDFSMTTQAATSKENATTTPMPTTAVPVAASGASSTASTPIVTDAKAAESVVTENREALFKDTSRLHPPQEAMMREIFISLYCAEGNNLRRWQLLLNAIDGQTANRPIYGAENDVKDMLRNRPNPANEGYVVVRVPPECVADLGIKDRSNHPLVQLKERSITPANIMKFVHTSGEYRFYDGVLQRI